MHYCNLVDRDITTQECHSTQTDDCSNCLFFIPFALFQLNAYKDQVRGGANREQKNLLPRLLFQVVRPLLEDVFFLNDGQ